VTPCVLAEWNIAAMKVSHNYERASDVFVGSDAMFRQVPGATQAAAARRLAAAARTHATTVMKPSSVNTVSSARQLASPKSPPKPIPMSQSYRSSCVATPQGPTQVPYDAKGTTFYDPELVPPRSYGLQQEVQESNSWQPATDSEAAYLAGLNGVALRSVPGSLLGSSLQASSSSASAGTSQGPLSERDLSAAAAAALSRNGGQALSAPSASRRELAQAPRDDESTAAALAASIRDAREAHAGGRMEVQGHSRDRRGSMPQESMRIPSRTPSSASNNRCDANDGPSKVRTRSIDVATRSSTSGGGRVNMSSATDRVTVHRRGSAAPQRQAAIFEDDCSEYSDRFLPGYEKGQLLGRGACAVVWMAVPSGSKTAVAIKQVAKGTSGKKKSDTDAARKEILFGSYFFAEGGEPKLPLHSNPGISHIAKLLDFVETKRDIWMVMEFGGTSLTKMAYEIKGEFNRGERLYRVHHLPLLESMKKDQRVLKVVLRQLISALCLFADHRIVHSDIKPDNILVEQDERGQIRVRFIDLGSAFSFSSPESLSLATPEYMPHEGLEVCAMGRNLLGGPSGPCGNIGALSGGISRHSVGGRPGQGKSAAAASALAAGDPAQRLQRQSQPWSFDTWSLGSIVLELSLGAPLWLSYKCRVANDNRPNSAGLGLFAVPGRDPEKIMQKQSDALRQRGLSVVLRNAPGVPIAAGGDDVDTGLDLLSRMMDWDPMERISPHDALRHPWLQD